MGGSYFIHDGRTATVSPTLSEESEQLIDSIGAANDPPKTAIPIDEGRRLLKELILSNVEAEIVGSQRDLLISGPDGPIPIRLYRPPTEGPQPIFVYFHGGGWVRGDLDTHDPLCSHLAEATDTLVISVDYRQPPEEPFPAAVVDAHSAVQWAAEHGQSIGGNPERLIVGGDSAGGNLTAAVTLLARELDDQPIDFQVLLYPSVNDPRRRWFDSYDEHDGYGDSMVGFEWAIQQYADGDPDRFNPLLFPLRAEHYSDLPPAVVLTCEFDILRDEGQAYADALETARVEVDRLFYDDVFHPFLCFPGLDRSQEAYRDVAAVIDERLAR